MPPFLKVTEKDGKGQEIHQSHMDGSKNNVINYTLCLAADKGEARTNAEKKTKG